MSVFNFWKPSVDIIVTRSHKTGKYFCQIVDSETRKSIGVSAARHTEDARERAIAEAHQMSRVRKVVVEE